MAKIDTAAVSVETMLTKFYAVPEFQREYVWKDKQVGKLLQDLYGAYKNRLPDSYFLGSIVYFPEGDDFHLVDGQQRIATIFLLISALRDRYLEVDENADVQILERAIRDPQMRRGGGRVDKYRVELQYPALSDVLKKIGGGEGASLRVPPATQPGRSLVKAYRNCLSFLRDQLGQSPDDLDRFVSFLWKDVEFITIQTEDVRSAFTIFETINDRGVGLDAMDLLKNLLFRETRSAADRNTLADRWKELLRVLREGGETRPIRFLRYFLIADYDFQRVPTASAVFDWLVQEDNRSRLGYGTNPLRFAQRLFEAAEAYSAFSQGLNTDGVPNDFLAGINYQKTGVRQHLCILLAARHLRRGAFETLCQRLETLVFAFAMTGAQWNEIERNLPAWTKSLRSARSEEDIEGFIASELDAAIAARTEALGKRLDALDSVAPRLQKYLLASLTQYLEEECGKGGALIRYFTESLEIEHILPQEPVEEAIEEFDPPNSDNLAKYIYRLGNLTLLHKPWNASASNRTFAQKSDVYRRSTYELTKALVSDISVGRNTKPKRAAKKFGLRPFSTWNATNLARRHRMLVQMTEEWWGIDLPSP